jgi:hypothetical protein
MKEANRFDLEQEILECWGVTADLDLLFEAVMEQDLSQDKIANILLGLKELYELKFIKAWNSFEGCIRNGQLS